MTATPDCELCASTGGAVLWHDDFCRVIAVDEPDYPGFCRVVLARHVREMTDLAPAERERLMRVVFAVEAALRALLAPDKVNLASLGNAVPHLHWHVIPRFRDDRHFPSPVWAAPARARAPARRLDRAALAAHLSGRLRQV
ncbi:MAG: HIT family protein [Burkholderiales bacterium]|nr:HIT family protein [Burkholderiales bacterium]